VFIADQGALMEDLRAHLKKRALGEIAGQEAPGSVPLDPNGPRLAYGDQNKLGRLAVSTPMQGRSVDSESGLCSASASIRFVISSAVRFKATI
jgi:hypothetical protein